MQKVISIAKDFALKSGPRFAKHGDFSGEQFREEFLEPALREYDEVVVNLDGTLGYGSSFLEEVFGGAVRSNCPVDEKLRLVSNDKYLVKEIQEYIRDAKAKANGG